MKRLLAGLALVFGLVAGAKAQSYWDEFPAYWVEFNGGDVLAGSIINTLSLGVPATFSVSGNPCTGGDCIINISWASATDDSLLLFNGTTGVLAAVPNCTDSAGNHINYTTATNTFSCGTSTSGGAPTGATYITQTADATLSAEQALSSLSTGLMRVATATGVITSLTDSSGLAANLSDEKGTTGGFLRTGGNVLTKGFSLETPGAAEKVPIFDTGEAMTITAVCATLIGSASPSVTYNIKYGSDLSAAGTSVTTSPTAVTSVTTCTAAAALNNTAPAANDHIWFITTAQSGTVSNIEVTIAYTIP